VIDAMGIKLRSMLFAAAFAAVSAATAQPVEPDMGANGEYFVVQQSRGAATVSLGGTVIPFKEVTLSAQLPGRINHLAGIEGDAFEKGTLLVSIDDRELLANRQAAVATLANADAALRNAGAQFTRELWSPRSREPVSGMGIPNLFDQMFTDPMESMMGR